MLCKNAVLFCNKNFELSEEINKFCKCNKINLVFSVDLAYFVYAYFETKPEIVFYDLDTIKFDERLFNMFVTNRHFCNTTVVLLSKEKKDIIFQNKNVHYFLYNEINCDMMKLIDSVELNQKYHITENELKEYKIKLTSLLRELGITTKHMGYNYIREIVLEIIKDERRRISLTKHLYPKIALKYNTFNANIERNIRNALNFTIKNCRNKEMMREIMPLGENVPSNKQFITFLVDKLTEC